MEQTHLFKPPIERAGQSQLTTADLTAGPEAAKWLSKWLSDILITFTKHSPSSEAAGHPAGQEIPHLLWSSEIEYHVTDNPPLDPILRKFSPPTNYFLRSALLLFFSMGWDYDVCMSLWDWALFYSPQIIHEWIWGSGEMVVTRENWRTQRKNLSQCQYVHHKSHIDWPGREPADPRWEAGD
jgi:hypothetical protein